MRSDISPEKEKLENNLIHLFFRDIEQYWQQPGHGDTEQEWQEKEPGLALNQGYLIL